MINVQAAIRPFADAVLVPAFGIGALSASLETLAVVADNWGAAAEPEEAFGCDATDRCSVTEFEPQLLPTRRRQQSRAVWILKAIKADSSVDLPARVLCLSLKPEIAVQLTALDRKHSNANSSQP
ncbi:MAG: hypothetical protein ABR577_12410 [Pyrinomonadaceae bacterium]